MTGVPEEVVPAVGTARRLQALTVVGWPAARLSRETGVSLYRLGRLLEGTLAAVTVDEARAVAVVYERFGAVSPGLHGVSHIAARAARDRAAAARWAPPAAWDEDTVDDPEAIPQWTGFCGSVRGALAHERDGIPLCPPCADALHRRRLRDQAADHRTARI